MPNKKKNSNAIKVALIAMAAIVIFIISFLINIVGFMQVANPNETDKSGLKLGFSSPDKEIKKEEEPKANNSVFGETSVKTNAIVLVGLKNNNWDRAKANLSVSDVSENGVCKFEEGCTLYCNNTYVNCIVFTQEYKDKVIEDITVGTSFEEIKEKLGKTGYTKNGGLAYKTGEYYIFFYEDEIVIYPNRNITNTSVEKLLFSYINGSYAGDTINLIVEFRRDYPDFVIKENKDNIEFTSVTRQMKVILQNDGSMNIVIYNGYNIGSEMKSHLKDNNITQEKNYLFEQVELERINA